MAQRKRKKQFPKRTYYLKFNCLKKVTIPALPQIKQTPLLFITDFPVHQNKLLSS